MKKIYLLIFSHLILINSFAQPWTITAYSDPPEGGTVNGLQVYTGNYPDGWPVRLEAEPYPGDPGTNGFGPYDYRFDEWSEVIGGNIYPLSGDQRYNPVYIFEATNDRELIANFEKPFEIGLYRSDDPDDPFKGYIQIRIKPSFNISAGTTIKQIQFGIMWNRTIVNGNKLDFDMVCESDIISKIYAIRQEGWDAPSPIPHNTPGDIPGDTWDYRNFEIIPDLNPSNQPKIPNIWLAGKWYTVAVLKVFALSPGHIADFGDFYIIPPGDRDPDGSHYNEATGYNYPSTYYKKSFNPVIQLEKDNNLAYNMQIGTPENPNPVPLPIPTQLAGYYWHGNGDKQGKNSPGYDGYSWNDAKNWRVGCGDTDIVPDTPPSNTDDARIPDVGELYNGDPYYPRNDCEDLGNDDIPAECNNLYIWNGRIEWMQEPEVIPSMDVNLTIWGDLEIGYSDLPIGEEYDNDVLTNSVNVYNKGHLNIGGDLEEIENPDLYFADLKIYESGGLNVYPGGYVDAFYDVYLEADTALVIHSNTNGTGSFINSYRRGGMHYNNDIHDPVKVETYVSGTENVYHMHFVGATVHDSTPGWENRVRLQQFDMTYLDTYAWEWDPTVNWEDPSVWVNVYPYWHPEPIGAGLTLTNGEAGTGTIEMEGKLIADNFSYNILYSSDNKLALISNPFSAPLNFNEFYLRNQSIIENKFRIYVNSPQGGPSGNYDVYTGGTNPLSEAFIQVGQAFFVHTKSPGGNVIFDTEFREHKRDIPFRDIIPNTLRTYVSGGTKGFKDQLNIRFDASATTMFDDEIETKKWNSASSDATMIRSIAEDGTELYTNVLPQNLLLPPNTYEVPVQFVCAENEIYTLSFKGMESFDYGTEIWLEDKFTGSELIEINHENSEYNFYGAKDEDKNRFIIHFKATFIPDFIDESESNLINIYSVGNELFLINNSKEAVREIAVFNILGQEILRVQVPEQSTYKLSISEPSGYYITRVRTDKNIYSEKVFIK